MQYRINRVISKGYEKRGKDMKLQKFTTEDTEKKKG
jgi:hypothetical protein